MTPGTGHFYFIESSGFEVVFVEFADKWCFFMRAEKFGLCMPTRLAAWVILPSAAERAF
jgi:hypothetical protein